MYSSIHALAAQMRDWQFGRTVIFRLILAGSLNLQACYSHLQDEEAEHEVGPSDEGLVQQAAGDSIELEVVQEEKAAALERVLGMLRLDVAGSAGKPWHSESHPGSCLVQRWALHCYCYLQFFLRLFYWRCQPLRLLLYSYLLLSCSPSPATCCLGRAGTEGA